MSLTAQQRGKIRRLSQPRELAPDEEGGELNIVPFLDIIVNVLIFVLATIVVTFTATIETTPPSGRGSGVRSEIQSEALNLTVIIVQDGFSLKASGGNIAPGCMGVGAGLAIPKNSGKYDYQALSECAAKLKEKFQDEDQAYIAANADIEYLILINVIDALRTSPRGVALFDNINFHVAR
jgi:biopolymer transport protein ExbD